MQHISLMTEQNMAVIHQTSLVSSGVKFGSNVTIGPFCVIEDDVEIGDNCHIMSHVVIQSGTKIGNNCIIHPCAILGGAPQNTKHKGGHTRLLVGNNCVIREGVTLHRGSDCSNSITVIGDNCMFLAYSHIGHDCVIGNNAVLANNAMVGGHVEIGNYVNIGGGAAIHQFVRIGSHAMVGGLTALVNDLIPYATALGVPGHLAGLNIVGMKRRSMLRSEIKAVRDAVKFLFDKENPIAEKNLKLKTLYSFSDAVQEISRFLSGESKRGFCVNL